MKEGDRVIFSRKYSHSHQKKWSGDGFTYQHKTEDLEAEIINLHNKTADIHVIKENGDRQFVSRVLLTNLKEV